ncbi:hypothetical protein SAMN04487897_102896 [Paenibacillus sp. yr247]|nr:hypothetical protein SAMN04487897_102896 [Paenibacillus sp. yr247]
MFLQRLFWNKAMRSKISMMIDISGGKLVTQTSGAMCQNNIFAARKSNYFILEAIR